MNANLLTKLTPVNVEVKQELCTFAIKGDLPMNIGIRHQVLIDHITLLKLVKIASHTCVASPAGKEPLLVASINIQGTDGIQL